MRRDCVCSAIPRPDGSFPGIQDPLLRQPPVHPRPAEKFIQDIPQRGRFLGSLIHIRERSFFFLSLLRNRGSFFRRQLSPFFPLPPFPGAGRPFKIQMAGIVEAPERNAPLRKLDDILRGRIQAKTAEGLERHLQRPAQNRQNDKAMRHDRDLFLRMSAESPPRIAVQTLRCRSPKDSPPGRTVSPGLLHPLRKEVGKIPAQVFSGQAFQPSLVQLFQILNHHRGGRNRCRARHAAVWRARISGLV